MVSHSGVNNPGRIWQPLCLGLLLVLPGLWVGLQLDDYFHWGLVTAHSAELQTASPASPWGLFSFVDGNPDRVARLVNMGLLPWWTLPQVEYAFWRPLTELTHGLDYSLWPQIPWLMHIQSMLYYGLMLWFGCRLFQQLQGETRAWLWAGFLFAVSYSHGVPAGWLANRNAVLATLFVILTLLAHHRWRQQSEPSALVLAVIWFAAGLLSGEMAVTAGAYLLAYAMCLDTRGWRQRVMSLLPYIVLGCGWLLVRAALGYGASGSGHYIDPLQSPLLFMQTLIGRGLDLLAGLFWVVPPELASSLPASRRPLLAGLLVLLVALLWPLLKRDRRARFWFMGSLLCLVPVASTIPHSRLLIAASIGAAGLLGLWVQHWRDTAPTRSGATRWLVNGAVGIVLFLQLVVSALLLPLEAWSMRLVGDAYVNQGARSWELDNLPADTAAILINPPLSSAGGYINGVRAYEGLPIARRTWLLASGQRPITLTVRDANSFELSSGQGLYDAINEGVLRGPQLPLALGDSVQLDGMVVTVLATDAGVPVRARYQFAQPLNSDHYRFSIWNAGQVVACHLPSIGQSIELHTDTGTCAIP